MTGFRRIAVATTGAAFVASALGMGPARATDGGRPQDAPVPTAEQLAQSVRVLALDGSVRAIVLEGSVTPIESVRKDGAATVLTLSSDIAFETAKFDLPPAARAKLAALVADIPHGAAVSVTGHTDSVADDTSNQILSDRRAGAVGHAIAATRSDLTLTVTGKGESEPIADELASGSLDPEASAKNRRVEIRYTGS